MQFELELALAFGRTDREQLMQELLISGELGYYRALFFLKGRVVDLSGKKPKSETAMTPDKFVERMNARG